MKTLYCVCYGVTSRHLTQGGQTFHKLKEAKEYIKSIPSHFPAWKLTRHTDSISTVAENIH